MTPEYRRAIKSIESSGGNYSLLGPVTKSGDRAYGAYQVMGNNIPDWTERHIGRRMTPEEFLRNEKAQDAVFDAQFGAYVSKYGNPQDAASAWFTGGPLALNGDKRDILGTTGNAYVDKFNKALGGPDMGALSFYEEPKAPALSGMDPGVLYAQRDPMNTIGMGLTGMGAALAGISSPEQSKALVAQQAAMQKQAVDQGTWSLQVLPNGQLVRMNSKGGMPQIVGSGFNKPEVDPGLKKSLDEQGKAYVDEGTNIKNTAASARTMMADLSQLTQALSNPALTQGERADWIHRGRKLLAYVSPNDAELAKTVSDGDVVNVIANRMVLQLVKSDKLLPGSFSDSDRQFVVGLGPGLTNSPEANKRIIEILERTSKRNLELEDARVQYVQNSKHGVLDRGWETAKKAITDKWEAENRALDERYKAARVPAQQQGPRPSLNQIFGR